MRRAIGCAFLVWTSVSALCFAADAPEQTHPRRLLLLYQKPDGHPAATHEYEQGLTLLHGLLSSRKQISVRLLPADEPWSDGPELLDGADGVVLFLAEGARWLSADQARLRAFVQLAERKGGLSCLHWAMGSKTAEPVPAFAKLFGGCHGGPDRKYRFLETTLRPAAGDHAVTRGIEPLRIRDEFYYALKWPGVVPPPQPLMEAEIDGQWETVSWAWERPDGGRSFGFSGLHFHENWRETAYQRLVVQGVRWTLRDLDE